MRKAMSLFLAAFMVAMLPTALRAEDDIPDMDDEVAALEQLDDDFAELGRSRWMRPHRGCFDEDDGDRGRSGFRCGPMAGRPGGPGPMMLRKPMMDAPGRHMGPMMSMKGKRGMHGMMGMRKLFDLDLDDAQKSRLVDVMTENYRNRLNAGLELASARDALASLYDSENPDADSIVAAHQAVGAAEGKMAVVRRGMMDEVKKILTPEQVEKLEKMDRPGRGPRGDRFRDGKDRRDGKGPRDGKFGPRDGMKDKGPKL